MRHNLFVFLLGNTDNLTLVIEDDKARTIRLFDDCIDRIPPSRSLIDSGAIHGKKNDKQDRISKRRFGKMEKRGMQNDQV